MKRWLKIPFAVAAALVALLIAAIVLLQIPAIQKTLCNKVLETVSEKTGLDIKVGDIHLALIDRIILDDIGVVNGRDTVITCRKAALSISPLSLLKGNIKINRLTLDGGTIYPSNFPAGGSEKAAKDSTASIPNLNLHIGRLQVSDFKVVNYVADAEHVDRSRSPRLIDFNDLMVTDLNLDIRNVDFDGSNASMKVKRISMREDISGAELQNLSFDADYDSTGVHIKGFNFKDAYSDITLSKGDILFSDFSDFENLFDKVALDATVQNSYLDLQSLHHFVDSIEFIELKLYVDGRFTGTVSNLKTESAHVYSGSKESYLDISAHLVGLPDAEGTMATIMVNDSYTNTRDIAEIVYQCMPDKADFNKKSISNLAPGTRFSFKGSLNGFFEDFVAYGAVTSNIGDARVDIECRNILNKGYEILGFMDFKEFDLGRFIQNDNFGKVTCHASASSMFALKDEDTEFYVEEISIPKFEFNGYSYSNISAAGNWKSSEFEGRVVSGDPNLKFMLQGILAPSSASGNSLYHIKLSLGHADLAALNFDKRDISSIRLNALADITQTPEGRLMGKITVSDVECKSPDGKFDLGDIEVVAFNGENKYMLGINSDMFKARYRGSAFITDIIPQLEGLVLLGKLDNLAKRMDTSPVLGNDRYDLSLKVNDLRNLLGFLAPGIHIESGSSVTVKSPGDSTGTVSVKSGLIALDNIYIQDLDAGFDFGQKSASAKIGTQMIRFGDIVLSDSRLKADCAGNSVLANFNFCNDPDSLEAGHLQAMVSFPNLKEGNQNMLLHLGHSFIRFGGEQWNIDPSSVYFSDKHISVNDFNIYNQDQGIYANGVLSESPRDTCAFDIRDLDLSLVDMLVKEPLNIRGTLSGTGNINAIFTHPDIVAEIAVDSLYLAGQEIGHIEVSSKWDDTLHRANLLATNTIQGRKALNITGYYEPEKENLYATVDADRLSVGFIEPFISTLATDVSGDLTSHIVLSGPLNSLDINSKGSHLENFCAKLDYTQVPYTMDGYIDFDSHKITLRDFDVKDAEKGTATLKGEVTHDHLKNFMLNIGIRAINLLGLDTNIHQNETFYGKGYATGRVDIVGPLEALAIKLNIMTREGTVINIPIGNATNKQTSIITFVDNRPKPKLTSIDSLINLNRVREQAVVHSGESALEVYARVRATEDATLNIEIDSDTGDALHVDGNGTVDITVKDGNFSILGDYTVSEGDYRLALLGLVTRDFTLKDGSTIHFTGDIMQSELNMTADYKTKASIAPLVSGSSESSIRRPVNCGIKVTERLANPNLSFTIDVDDLDPTTQALIDNTLNTEEKRMRQFLALILSGSFIPDEQSGIVNNNSLSYFNATEIMSNQLNNIFQQLNIPLDLGFNYQPTSSGHDVFDVAVSTQLINNRVSVNGNIGNRRFQTSNRDDIVGNVDVEIKLDRSGKTRLSLFSHSADEYSNYLDQTQRNGIGISYQQEFNTLKELFSPKRRPEINRSAPPTGEALRDSTASAAAVKAD